MFNIEDLASTLFVLEDYVVEGVFQVDEFGEKDGREGSEEECEEERRG